MIHTSVHQPVDDRFPGLGLAKGGGSGSRGTKPGPSWRSRGSTYLARSSYMLQQGHVRGRRWLYFYGEDSNITAHLPRHVDLTSLPAINFDYINGDAILHRLVGLSGGVTAAQSASALVLALD